MHPPPIVPMSLPVILAMPSMKRILEQYHTHVAYKTTIANEKSVKPTSCHLKRTKTLFWRCKRHFRFSKMWSSGILTIPSEAINSKPKKNKRWQKMPKNKHFYEPRERRRGFDARGTLMHHTRAKKIEKLVKWGINRFSLKSGIQYYFAIWNRIITFREKCVK